MTDKKDSFAELQNAWVRYIEAMSVAQGVDSKKVLGVETNDKGEITSVVVPPSPPPWIERDEVSTERGIADNTKRSWEAVKKAVDEGKADQDAKILETYAPIPNHYRTAHLQRSHISDLREEIANLQNENASLNECLKLLNKEYTEHNEELKTLYQQSLTAKDSLCRTQQKVIADLYAQLHGSTKVMANSQYGKMGATEFKTNFEPASPMKRFPGVHADWRSIVDGSED